MNATLKNIRPITPSDKILHSLLQQALKMRQVKPKEPFQADTQPRTIKEWEEDHIRGEVLEDQLAEMKEKYDI